MKVCRALFFSFLLLCVTGAPGFTLSPAYAASLVLQAGTSAAAASESQPKENHQDNGDEGEDVFRHSAMVQKMGGWLHLDKEAAARLFEYLNFAVLAGAILFALLKYLPRMFRKNRETLQQQLVDARTATEQSHERLAAIEQRLSRLDEEIVAIGKQAEKDSLEDEARIKASIEIERKRIVEAVGKDIAAAGSAAQRELKRFAAGLAVDRAGQGLSLTENDDRELVQEFAQSLGHQVDSRGKN